MSQYAAVQVCCAPAPPKKQVLQNDNSTHVHLLHVVKRTVAGLVLLTAVMSVASVSRS